MLLYQKISEILDKSPRKHQWLKFLFNLSPMYRRTCGKLIEVSPDFKYIKGKISLSYRNYNYNGTLFGDSILSATDPIYSVQLTQILGKDYVVWDKSVTAKFKPPVRRTVYIEYHFKMKK
ncbi:hypothetical protein ACF3NR_11550 [Vaginella massiliensis]|uniref:hypothetical protein n=1 Tax=Vaginella massiliensis TaxID=1816680 RepID=UPI003752DC2F